MSAESSKIQVGKLQLEKFYRQNLDSSIRINGADVFQTEAPCLFALYEHPSQMIGVLLDYSVAASMSALSTFLPSQALDEFVEEHHIPDDLWSGVEKFLKCTQEYLNTEIFPNEQIEFVHVYEYAPRLPKDILDIIKSGEIVCREVTVLTYKTGGMAFITNLPLELANSLDTEEEEITASMRLSFQENEAVMKEQVSNRVAIFFVLAILLVITFALLAVVFNKDQIQQNTTVQKIEETQLQPKLTLDTVPIPAGSFLMGCLDKKCSEDTKAHSVTIPQAFLMMRSEVTQQLYKEIMGNNPSYSYQCGDDCPVENVTWEQAVEFSNRLSKLWSLTACYHKVEDIMIWDLECTGWRLPTEAEWEYAARGGQDAANDKLSDRAWYDELQDEEDAIVKETLMLSGNRTHAVCQKEPNAFGLCDMQGNVWEWTWDWYDKSYDISSVKGQKTILYPMGPKHGRNRVLRGGSWNSKKSELDLHYRAFLTPWATIGNVRYLDRNKSDIIIEKGTVGFRVVRTIPAKSFQETDKEKHQEK